MHEIHGWAVGWLADCTAATAGIWVLILALPTFGITPVPLFTGDKAALTAALKATQTENHAVWLSEDHLNALYSPSGCVVTGWAQNAILSHTSATRYWRQRLAVIIACSGWQLIGVQKLAPAAKRSLARADIISVTGFSR